MAGEARFTVTNARARRLVIQPEIKTIAEQLAADAAARTPRDTGKLAGGWRVSQGRDPGTSLVQNDTPYGIYVEYGTARRRAAAMLGAALAAARGAYR
jgi:hypothetical protein